MEPVKIFVYGTLRTEYGSIGQRVCSDSVRGAILDLGAFPGYFNTNSLPEGSGLVESDVIGEVIAIHPTTLSQLDFYEGVDRGLYRRIKVTTKNGHKCFIYEFNPEMLDNQLLSPYQILDGDWIEYLRRKPV